MDYQTRLETNRSGFWEIRWTETDKRTGKGRTRSVSTRTADRHTAEKVRRDFLRADAEEAIRAGGVSVGVLFDAYAAAAAARGVGPTQVVCLAHLKTYFGSMEPAELTPDAVLDYRKSRGVADSTVRRELNTLTAVLGWAAKHKKIAAAPEIDLPPEGAARAVFLDEALEGELFALASVQTERARPGAARRLSRAARFICIGLDTGARKAAIEGLTWDRVDLARGVIDFRDPGQRVTRKRRIATPITTRLLPVLTRAAAERRPRDEFVLDNNGNIRKAWANFMTLHGFEAVTPHVLRHTRITLLLRAGVSIWDVSALVGASPAVIQDVYGHHVTDDRLRAQANRRAA